MEENQVWEALRARYYNDWKREDPANWPPLALKLEMIEELRADMRKIANSGEMDNARDTGTE